jgi:hypothetical protein
MKFRRMNIATNGQAQRRSDKQAAKHHGFERPIPRVASLTVDCQGVNISLYTKTNMEAFEQQDCQAAIVEENSMLLLHCCDPHYDLCFTVPSLPFLKLHGTCCHFSFMNNPSERRSCVIPNSEALLSKLDGVKSPCIINVKTSAVFKVGILQCITVN